MTRDDRMLRLCKIADLLRDRDIARLSDATRAVTAIDRHLAALDQPHESGGDVADALARQRYDRWADARRRLLLPQRDRLETARKEAADQARLAFGRAQVLSQLQRE